MKTLVVVSFGNPGELNRAVFALLSFYAHSPHALKTTRALIYTDCTDYLKRSLQGMPAEYIALSADRIQEMRGAVNYLYRTKIVLIEDAFRRAGTDLLYFDTDTFFMTDATPLLDQVSPQLSIMHRHEYLIDHWKDFPLPGTVTNFYSFVKAGSVNLADGSVLPISPAMSSWNSGVMVLHESHRAYIPDVLALSDQFFAATRNRASEQYAFSIILQTRTRIEGCERMVYHYWLAVQKKIIDAFLAKEMDDHWTTRPLEEKLGAVREWTATLPAYLDSHVLTARQNAIDSLNARNFRVGLTWAAKAILKDPFGDRNFLPAVFSQLKTQLFSRAVRQRTGPR